MKVHNVRYENGGFYLTITNLRGYFILTLVIILVLLPCYSIIKNLKLLIEDMVN